MEAGKESSLGASEASPRPDSGHCSRIATFQKQHQHTIKFKKNRFTKGRPQQIGIFFIHLK